MTDGSVQKFQPRLVTRPRHQVEQQIRTAILEGDFAQGEKLPPETALAQQFGVSRPTIREALGSLATAGLIRKIPGVAGGSFVNTVTADSLSQMLIESVDTILRLGALDIGELTAVRVVLEVPAAELAAQNRRQDDIDAMRTIVESQRHTTIDDPMIPEYDLAFHKRIGRASGNRLLAAFIGAVHDSAHPVRYLTVTQQVASNTVKQHMAILAGIEAGDPIAAREAMAEHLSYIQQYSRGQVTSD